jgi:hypothetical protein
VVVLTILGSPCVVVVPGLAGMGEMGVLRRVVVGVGVFPIDGTLAHGDSDRITAPDAFLIRRVFVDHAT